MAEQTDATNTTQAEVMEVEADPIANEETLETTPGVAESVREVNKVSLENELDPDPAQEQEKTLTDHLNKKLLQSFMLRLDAGSVSFPPDVGYKEEIEDDFDD